MEDTSGEINRQIEVPHTPWEITRVEFGENFYLHGAPDRIANQIRKQGKITAGSFIKAGEDTDNTAFAYAIESTESGHFSRVGRGIKIGTIFVVPLRNIIESGQFTGPAKEILFNKPYVIHIGPLRPRTINVKSRNTEERFEKALQPSVTWVAEIPADMIPKDPRTGI